MNIAQFLTYGGQCQFFHQLTSSQIQSVRDGMCQVNQWINEAQCIVQDASRLDGRFLYATQNQCFLTQMKLNQAAMMLLQGMERLERVNDNLGALRWLTHSDSILDELFAKGQEALTAAGNLRAAKDELVRVSKELERYRLGSHQLYNCIEAHRGVLNNITHESGQNVYIRPEITGLWRPIQYDADQSTFIHFNKLKCGDPYLGIGSDKKVKTTIKCETGEIFASVSFQEDPNHPEIKIVNDREIRNLKTFQGILEFVQLISQATYLNKKEKLTTKLILKYYEMGDLRTLLRGGQLTLQAKHAIAGKILAALTKMHEKGYLHRNIMPKNILIGYRQGILEAVLGSLSSACERTDEVSRNERCTSPYVASPEYVNALLQPGSLLLEATTEKHDVWAVGVVLYTMYATTVLPWLNLTDETAILKKIQEITSCEGWIVEPEKNSLAHVIWKMLQTNPADRYSAQEASQRFDEAIKMSRS